ncbi:MAG: c-type cytochrome [Deltaproteobacteria bacterium]|nr:c-type cytochrome [Deltaproteobacteria bacterium]
MNDEVKRTDEIQGEILHVYDDIEEADNNLPVWWLLTFYAAIAFGLVYWFYYHEYGIGKLPPQIHAEAIAAAEAERSIVTDESLDALALDESAVEAGQEIFMAQCFACHDAQGQGREGLGPNLTDKYWVHGGAAARRSTSTRRSPTVWQPRACLLGRPSSEKPASIRSSPTF